MTIYYSSCVRAHPGRAAIIAVALGMLLSGCDTAEPNGRYAAAPPGNPFPPIGGNAPYLSPTPRSSPAATSASASATSTGTIVAPTTGPYAGTGPNALSPAVSGLPARIYFATATGLTMLDAGTLAPAGQLSISGHPRAVVPSFDLSQLWVITSKALVPIGVHTGKRGKPVTASGVSSLLFTPDGRAAITLAGSAATFRDPVTMRARHTVHLPCAATTGDFTAGGDQVLLACADRVLRLDLAKAALSGQLRIPGGARQLRLGPDGTTFYAADPAQGGLWLINAASMQALGFVPAAGAGSLLVSRDASLLYTAGGGSINVVPFSSREVAASWPVNAPATLLAVSADGHGLFVAAGRALELMSAQTGAMTMSVPIPPGVTPAGTLVFPQPGQHSLGPGLMR